MKEEILRVNNLSKFYSNNMVLQNVCFNLYKGEIIGIMGLHNTGKTVLCNILSGNEKFCNGRIFFEEEHINIPYLIKNNYIYMIHKKSSLIHTLSIMENVFIIRKGQKRMFFINRKIIQQELNYWFKELNIRMSPSEKAGKLSKAQQYIIEILKAYIFGAKIIIIDDISFENKPNELNELNMIIENFKSKGISFIITSYQIKLLQLYSDRIYFISNGNMVKCIQNVKRKQIDIKNILLKSEYGIANTRNKPATAINKNIFKLVNVANYFFKNISFELNRGEILVIFDYLKDSNEALWKLLKGQDQIDDGSILYQGVYIKSPKNLNQKEVVFSDFNMNKNIYEYLSVSENICISNYNRLSNFGLLRKRRIRFIEKEFSQWYGDDELIEKKYCTNLSEKEKIAIYMYRLRLQAGSVVFCKNPEQIADYVTFQLIEQELCHMADQGMAVCILTSNIENISRFADRIIAISEGRIEGYITPTN